MMGAIVIIESPYAGEVEENLLYLRACMADCFSRGEVPFASHGLYTQPGVLDDRDPSQRERGIQAGFIMAEALHRARDVVPLPGRNFIVTFRAFYVDRGWSKGMEQALVHASKIGQRIEIRRIA